MWLHYWLILNFLLVTSASWQGLLRKRKEKEGKKKEKVSTWWWWWWWFPDLITLIRLPSALSLSLPLYFLKLDYAWKKWKRRTCPLFSKMCQELSPCPTKKKQSKNKGKGLELMSRREGKKERSDQERLKHRVERKSYFVLLFLSFFLSFWCGLWKPTSTL